MNRTQEKEIIRALCTAGREELAKQFARSRGYRVAASKHPVEAAAKDALATYLDEAEYRFWTDVAKLVNKWAKSKGKATVKRGRAIVWFEYSGTDSSDFEVEMTMSLHTNWPDVKVSGDLKSAYLGNRSIDYNAKVGEVTVSVIADLIIKHLSSGQQ